MATIWMKYPIAGSLKTGAFKVLTEGGEESNKGLVTDKVYKDFALALEFKVDKGSNSGIFSRWQRTLNTPMPMKPVPNTR